MIHKRLIGLNLTALLAFGSGCQGNDPRQAEQNAAALSAPQSGKPLSGNRGRATPASAVAKAPQPIPVLPAVSNAGESAQPQSESKPRSESLDRFLDLQGRKSLTLDFEGQGTKTTVVYGRFKDTFSSGSQGVVLLNIVFHENPPVIKKGDYGVVILPTGPAGKPTLLVVGEGDIFERARGSDSLDCWSPHGKEDGIYLGIEPAAGVLYFRKGWRFAFCAD